MLIRVAKQALVWMGLLGFLALPACTRDEGTEFSERVEDKADEAGETVEEGADDVKRSAEDLAD